VSLNKLRSSIALTIFAAALACAQTATDSTTFEVASVKPDTTGSPRFKTNGGPLPTGPFNQADHNPERITWTNVWLMHVLQVAYDLPADRIAGPGWPA